MSEQPWLSVILPTIGRDGLERALISIYRQAVGGVEILVVEDTLSGSVPHVRELAERYGARYLPHAGTEHCWGHEQRQAGMQAARGRYLAWMADDDIYTEDAFLRIQQAIERQADPHPLLFRIRMNQYGGRFIWQSPGPLAIGNIDAECIVTPNDPARLGTWALRYEGDFDFIKETVDLHGRCRWADPVIAVARPTDDEDWTR
jgi:glycosyltransferase involved in cell wall biosynthesis